MEIKQLEYFLAASNMGSLSKAAAALYTSQPNVSRAITSLERELGYALFERTSKGLRLTSFGKSIYEYAENALTNIRLIANSGQHPRQNRFTVSTYSSNLLAWLMVELNQNHPELTIFHHQGTVEEITNHVAHGISEIGILYVSKKQLNAFRQIITHKKVEFVELGKHEACIYVGPCNPLYDRETVSIEELTNLHFVRGLNDFFSMEYHLEQVDMGVGAVRSENLQSYVYTNSEHYMTNLLLKTDLVELGINVLYPFYQQYNIKNLRVVGEDAYLILGYVRETEHDLSETAIELIERLQSIVEL